MIPRLLRVHGVLVPVDARQALPAPAPAAGAAGTGAADAELRADLGRLLGTRPGIDIVLRTSGSTTGTGRLVGTSVQALVASARATHARLGGPGRWVLALPAHHVAGLQVLVRSLVAGVPPVVVDLEGGFDPRALGRAVAAAASAGPATVGASLGDPAVSGLATGSAQGAVRGNQAKRPVPADPTRGVVPVGRAALARQPAGPVQEVVDPALVRLVRQAAGPGTPTPPARVYVSLVPTQLHRVLQDPQATADLARATAVLVGGASASADLLGRARSAGIAVVTTYGMTETGGGCVYDGVALEGVRVRVEGPEGRIVISGPVVAQGYVGDAGGGCEFRQGPWGREVWTCDRGRVEADGRLTVLGRLDDIIVTGGLKVDPHLVESVLTSIDGVRQACVVGVEDQEWGSVVAAAVVPAPGSRPDAQEVRRAARALLDGAHTPKRVRVLPALPLRGPGKVDRRAVAQLLAGDVSGAP